MDITANTQMPGQAFTEHHVDAAGFRIRYAETGNGPPLVVLPTSAGLTFAAGFDLLAQDFRVIMLDPPGWGDSPATEESPPLPDLAKITAEALAALGLDSYHLAGGSMGGIHALWLTAYHPNRVRTLILDGCMAFRKDHWSMPGMDPAPLVAAAKQGADVSMMIPPPHPSKPWADLAFRTRQLQKILRVMALVGPEYDDDLAARLRDVTTPVLALFGETDHFLHNSIAGVYESLLRNCKSIIIDAASHDVPGEQPQAYAHLVKNFIQSHA
jgi:pimeloyl-ACP methyl ester carboxylesterase